MAILCLFPPLHHKAVNHTAHLLKSTRARLAITPHAPHTRTVFDLAVQPDLQLLMCMLALGHTWPHTRTHRALPTRPSLPQAYLATCARSFRLTSLGFLKAFAHSSGAGRSSHLPPSTPQSGTVLGVPFPHYGQYGSVLSPPGTLVSCSSRKNRQGPLPPTRTVVSSSEWKCARGPLPPLWTIWVCRRTSRYSARVRVSWLPYTRTSDRSCCLSRKSLLGEPVLGVLFRHCGQ